MLDVVQILLTVVITILTVLLTVIGVQVFQILRELKKTVEKMNEVLDDTHTITHSISEPVQEVSGLVKGLKKGVGLVEAVTSFGKFIREHSEKKEKKTDKVKEAEISHEKSGSLKQAIKKRFFVKSGRQLSSSY